MDKLCKIDGCTKEIKNKGMCLKHYTRALRHGDPSVNLKPRVKTSKCTIDKCEENHFSKGLCNRHYKHYRKYGNYDLPPKLIKRDPICSVDGCERKHYGKNFCIKHYLRNKNHGSPLIINRESHGMTGTPEHNVWRRMIARCTYPSIERYPRYGGRGIKVCDRWLNSFSAFYADMGDRPTPKHQIDRIDNDGNYEPSNCKWSTPSENSLNRSTSIKNKKVRED